MTVVTDQWLNALRGWLDLVADVEAQSQCRDWIAATRRLLAEVDRLRVVEASRAKDDEDTLTTFRCGFFLRVAPRTVSKWCDEGRLKHRRESGTNNRLVKAADLVAFMREHGMTVPEELREEPDP